MTVHFSDGFETNDFSVWTGTAVIGENEIETSITRAKVGNYSAVVGILNAINGEKAYCYKTYFGDLGSGEHIWGSAWWFFPTGFNAPTRVWLFSFEERESPYKNFQICLNASNELEIWDALNGGVLYTQGSPVAIPLQQWLGLELYLYVHDSAGIVALWQNGIKIIEQTGIDTLCTNNYGKLLCGAPYIGGTWDGPDDYWFDEVYVQDEQKIPPAEGWEDYGQHRVGMGIGAGVLLGVT